MMTEYVTAIHTATGDKRIDYNALANKPTSMNPTSHASQHASDGSDPITPESIGAASSSDMETVKTELADFTQYVWKRRRVDYSVTLGDLTIIGMTTYSSQSSSTCSFSYSTSYTVNRDSNALALPNSTNASVAYDSSGATTSTTLNTLKGKYWLYDGTFYYTPADAADSTVTTTSTPVGSTPEIGVIYNTVQVMRIIAQPVTFSGITYGDWETITSTNATAYPETYAYSDGYEYIKYGGMDRRQTSTAIKQASYYGTGIENDITIYVDEIPTFFMVASDGIFTLFRWGNEGYVLSNGSSVMSVNTTYDTSNKSITFKYNAGLISGVEGNPLNTANKRYWCYFFYG